MTSEQWEDWTWQEDTGCHACAKCNTDDPPVDCEDCDGCDDYSGCDIPCDPCRVPGDCTGGCWLKETNSLMGKECSPYDSMPSVNRPNGKETKCFSGCEDCGEVPPPGLQQDCPCYYVCDCIEQGMEEGDICCPFGDIPTDLGGGNWECPNTDCPGYRLGDAGPLNIFNPKTCECLSCVGGGGGFGGGGGGGGSPVPPPGGGMPTQPPGPPIEGLELISTPEGCVWVMNPSPTLPRCP